MKSPLWEPTDARIAQAAMTRFIGFVNERHGLELRGYDQLYHWSVTRIPAFWAAVWDFCGIIASRRFDRVVDGLDLMPGACWFPGARLNFAENLLRFRDDQPAIVFRNETGDRRELSYRELYEQVARLTSALRQAGVTMGDRVAGYLPNLPETVMAMLATTSLGATWSSCSPDFGTRGVLDRFGQIGSKVLFATDGYTYQGKAYDTRDRVREVATAIPGLERVVIVPYLDRSADLSVLPKAVVYEDFIATSAVDAIEFAQLPAEHPLYIMYSSGTTGPPKCLVQGAAGILTNHLKELVLHTDLRRDDRIFYQTTCGWMMWNWLVSSLAVGATIILYEGAPFHPLPDTLWQMADEERVSVFGTSATYLSALEKAGVRPGRSHDLSHLRAILSTGSPLAAEGFDYVYREIKTEVQLASISGGTDLNGCFALGNPTGPVYRGELQCRGLGMAVQVFGENGRPLKQAQGELVCTVPFPSMPLFFWNDPDGTRYRQAYFARFPGVWTHGDWCRLTETGGMIIYGRSDATLNPGGVRIGTAEIYRVTETIPAVSDSLAVGQEWEGDERVILFVRLAPGAVLDATLQEEIRRRIREEVSPRHVPARIIAVADIPYTVNMKKVELAVRNIINGRPVRNREALRNPEALELYHNLPELRT